MKIIPSLIGIILTFLALWLIIAPIKGVQQVISSLNSINYDLSQRLDHNSIDVNKQIVIVDIDEKSLKKIGRWPWPRTVMADLTTKLHALQPKVIAFNILFAESENDSERLLQALAARQYINQDAIDSELKNDPTINGDLGFANALKVTPAVLAFGLIFQPVTINTLPHSTISITNPAVLEAKGFISNIPIIQAAAKYAGFISYLPDNDGIIRRSVLVMQYHHVIYPSLALQAAALLMNETPKLIIGNEEGDSMIKGVMLGKHRINTDSSGQILIHYAGVSHTFPYYSASDVLDNAIPAGAFKDKLILIGTSAAGLGDIQATPVQSVFPGVEIQANLVNGILNNNFFIKPSWSYLVEMAVTLLLGILAALIMPHLSAARLTVLLFILPAIIFFGNLYIKEQTQLIFTGLIPILLVNTIGFINLIYGYLVESRLRRRVKDMFGQYVPEELVNQMIKSPKSYHAAGEDREMSVLFADIRHFTDLSENLSASEIVTMLNTIFTPLTEVIVRTQGTIDKYVGDLIMAFWSAPLSDVKHATHAVEAALAMQKSIHSIQAELTRMNLPVIRIGIGINSGMMSVGNVGSRYRRSYTVLGDTVNLASRVEGLTKFYDVDILATESTVKMAPDFLYRKIDIVQVKGKKQIIAIYEVLMEKAMATPAVLAAVQQFHEALNAYYQQQWDEAVMLIQALMKRDTSTKIYQLYLDRIAKLRTQPLPANWDGVYTHESK